MTAGTTIRSFSPNQKTRTTTKTRKTIFGSIKCDYWGVFLSYWRYEPTPPAGGAARILIFGNIILHLLAGGPAENFVSVKPKINSPCRRRCRFFHFRRDYFASPRRRLLKNFHFQPSIFYSELETFSRKYLISIEFYASLSC